MSIEIRRYAREAEIRFLATKDGLPAGCVEADNHAHAASWFWVSRMLVQPHARGQGLATELMRLLCEELDARGATAYLAPHPYDHSIDYLRLVALYERFGFAFEDSDDGGYWVRRAAQSSSSTGNASAAH